MFTIISSLLLILISLYIYYRKQKLSDSLPGPWNLPVIGALHLIDQKAPHMTLTKLAQKYGSIFGIKFGLMYNVVISDPKLAHKILAKPECDGRPPYLFLSFIFREQGLAFSQGKLWRENRRCVVNFLRTSKISEISLSSKLLENYITRNVQYFIQNMKCKPNRIILDPEEDIIFYNNNLTSNLLFGRSWSRDDQGWKTLKLCFYELEKLAGLGGILNFLPFLRLLPYYKSKLDSGKRAINTIRETLNKITSKCQQNYLKNNSNETLCFVDSFLRQNLKIGNISEQQQDKLENLVFDLYAASGEPNLYSIIWILYYLAAHPDVQDRVRKELCDVLQNKTVQIEDIKHLHYMQATVAEVARIRSIVPLGIPHFASEDIKIKNMKIPKGATIMILHWAMHMNPNIWEKPEEFRPERFLDKEGNFQESELLMTFQEGRRVCVGKEIAKCSTFLFVGTILQNFIIEENEPLDLTGISGLAFLPKPQKLAFNRI